MSSTPMKVLVANRGEIALRLHRGLRSLGLETVAVYSEADRAAPYVRAASAAVAIGPAEPAQSYLDIGRLIEAGRATGANAVHPGYGFLSENADFAAAVESEGWTFIGPTAESIRAMGDKTEAGRLARDAGVPIIPSFIPDGPATTEQLHREAEKIGLPVMVKAAAGGGGKGMRIIHTIAELDAAITSAVREAESAFGDGRVFLERFVERARHVEVQVVGDGRGGGVAFGERDCSIQRRHQKLIEETPAPNLDEAVRDEMHAAAVALVAKTGYRGAGTVEFILAGDRDYFFLEMNTRLQVEHPVTEMVHGVDLLAQQVAVARGEAIEPAQPPRGHAIEARIYAEDPANGFLPSIGTLAEVVWPSGPGIRVDAGVERGSDVTLHYDPLLAKIIAYGHDREHAIERLRAALAETLIAGVATTTGFCRDVVACTAFRDADLHTGIIAEEMTDWSGAIAGDAWLTAAGAVALGLDSGPTAAGPTGPLRLFDSLGGWRMA